LAFFAESETEVFLKIEDTQFTFTKDESGKEDGSHGLRGEIYVS
jgi:hypothetical protein